MNELSDVYAKCVADIRKDETLPALIIGGDMQRLIGKATPQVRAGMAHGDALTYACDQRFEYLVIKHSYPVFIQSVLMLYTAVALDHELALRDGRLPSFLK